MTARYDLSDAVAVHVSVSSAGCTQCGDEFAPVEGSPAPLDPDEPRFCSDGCEEAYNDSDSAEFEDLYREARYGSAPVWP